MRVLLVASANPTSKTGVTAHYNRLQAHLSGRVESVQLITPFDAPGWLKAVLGAGRRVARWFGSDGRVLFLELENFLRIWTTVRQKGANAFDLIHAQDVTAGAAAALAISHRVPVIMTCHFNDGPITEYEQRFTLRGITKQWLSTWFRYLFQQPDAFITVSAYTKRLAVGLLPAETPCMVIHNGVVFPAVIPRDENDTLVIASIGTLEDRKNQRLLIDAATELHQRGFTHVRVWLLGEGSKQAEWQALVRERNLEECILFLGFQPNVTDILERVSLYVHTARNESWGYTVTEAIAAGTPVLALATGGIPEQFDSQKPGLLPPETTPAELADAILRYQLPDARHRLADQQWRYAQANFRLDRIIDQHLNLYRSMLNRPLPDAAVNAEPVFTSSGQSTVEGRPSLYQQPMSPIHSKPSI